MTKKSASSSGGGRPSDDLSAQERAEALGALREAHLLSNGDSVKEGDADPNQVLLLDLYTESGRRLPNRVVGSAEPIAPIPDATTTVSGRQVLRNLRAALYQQLEVPPEQTALDPFPESELRQMSEDSATGDAFRARVVELLGDDADQIEVARRGTVASREIDRAVRLADRAARCWAGLAFAAEANGAQTAFDDLEEITSPREGAAALARRALNQRRESKTAKGRDLAKAVGELSRALQQIDIEADNEVNEPAFRSAGASAARTLLLAGGFLGQLDFIVAEANALLDQLASQ